MSLVDQIVNLVVEEMGKDFPPELRASVRENVVKLVNAGREYEREQIALWVERRVSVWISGRTAIIANDDPEINSHSKLWADAIRKADIP